MSTGDDERNWKNMPFLQTELKGRQNNKEKRAFPGSFASISIVGEVLVLSV